MTIQDLMKICKTFQEILSTQETVHKVGLNLYYFSCPDLFGWVGV